MSRYPAFVLDGPLKLDIARRKKAIEIVTARVTAQGWRVDPDGTYDELDFMTPEEFVDRFYDYWRHVRTGSRVNGCVRFTTSQQMQDLVQIAEDVGLLAALKVKLELW